MISRASGLWWLSRPPTCCYWYEGNLIQNLFSKELAFHKATLCCAEQLYVVHIHDVIEFHVPTLNFWDLLSSLDSGSNANMKSVGDNEPPCITPFCIGTVVMSFSCLLLIICNVVSAYLYALFRNAVMFWGILSDSNHLKRYVCESNQTLFLCLAILPSGPWSLWNNLVYKQCFLQPRVSCKNANWFAEISSFSVM